MANKIFFNDAHDKLISHLKKLGVNNQKVLDAISLVPRHLYVESAFRPRAYDDDALPIGFNQTISSPSIVAKMTQLLVIRHLFYQKYFLRLQPLKELCLSIIEPRIY